MALKNHLNRVLGLIFILIGLVNLVVHKYLDMAAFWACGLAMMMSYTPGTQVRWGGPRKLIIICCAILAAAAFAAIIYRDFLR